MSAISPWRCRRSRAITYTAIASAAGASRTDIQGTSASSMKHPNTRGRVGRSAASSPSSAAPAKSAPAASSGYTVVL